MDAFFFSKLLEKRHHKPESVGWLEILNYRVCNDASQFTGLRTLRVKFSASKTVTVRAE